MADRDVEYELFVKGVVEQLLEQQGMNGILVRHNVGVTGISGQSHQIDVLLEYAIAGILTRVAVECKNYKGRVEISDVKSMKGLMNDIPGLQGIIATRKGYQRGAERFARAHGIGLRIVRPPQIEDYAGHKPWMIIRVAIRTPIIRSITFVLDREWYIANKADAYFDMDLKFHSHQVFVESSGGGQKQTLLNVLRGLHDLSPEVGIEYDHKIALLNSFIYGESIPLMKINRVDVSCVVQERTFLLGNELAHAVFRDIIGGSYEIVGYKNSITLVMGEIALLEIIGYVQCPSANTRRRDMAFVVGELMIKKGISGPVEQMDFPEA